MNLPSKNSRTTYPAYTLIEMLIVLTIFIILSAIGFFSFGGLRDTVTLNQDVLTLEQDFRWAQRSALFLERGRDERWLYGIGIDFSNFEADGEYRLFKWCSQFADFGDARTKANFPNFDPAFEIGPLNGNFPITGYASSACSLGSGQSELVKIPGRLDGRVSPDFQNSIPDTLDADGDGAGVPMYIVFEAVSGRTFFYDDAGNLVNYESGGDIVSEPIDFRVEITAPTTGRKKTIVIGNISGRISIESEQT